MVMRGAGEHHDFMSALDKLMRESSHDVGSRDVVGRENETEDQNLHVSGFVPDDAVHVAGVAQNQPQHFF